jgi:hypothetical protein
LGVALDASIGLAMVSLVVGLRLPAACGHDADAESAKVSHSDGVTLDDESRQTCDHFFQCAGDPIVATGGSFNVRQSNPYFNSLF